MPIPDEPETVEALAHAALDKALDDWAEMTPPGTVTAMDLEWNRDGRELVVTMRFRPADD